LKAEWFLAGADHIHVNISAGINKLIDNGTLP